MLLTSGYRYTSMRPMAASRSSSRNFLKGRGIANNSSRTFPSLGASSPISRTTKQPLKGIQYNIIHWHAHRLTVKISRIDIVYRLKEVKAESSRKRNEHTPYTFSWLIDINSYSMSCSFESSFNLSRCPLKHASLQSITTLKESTQ